MIPKNQQAYKKIYRTFDQREKNIFDSRCIQIVMYDDMNIKNQVDVFYRVSHGERLSEDEIMNHRCHVIHDKQILKLLTNLMEK